MVLCRYWQNRALQEALATKESFLRGITHELRTPIHGILGSAELLTEVLKTRTVIPEITNRETEQLDLYTYVQTIKTSARELISTVNSLIKLNQWADIAQAERVMSLHSIAEIETALLHEVLMGLSDDLSVRPSIIISNCLPPHCDMLVIDMRIFLDCIQPLVVYAAQQSAGGVVAVNLTVTEDLQFLFVDVYQSGCNMVKSPGSTLSDVDGKDGLSTMESALGLTVACKAATLLDGQVALLSSKHDSASYVRATFNDPIFASSISTRRALKDKPVQTPQTFHRLISDSPTSSLSHHFGLWLSNTGWQECKEKAGSLVILDYSHDLPQFCKQLASVGSEQVVICLVPEHASFVDFQNKRLRRQDNAVYIQGPFLTDQMVQAMELVTAMLVEFGTSIMQSGGHISATDPTCLSVPQKTAILPISLVEEASISAEKLRSELTESLQSLTIQPKPSLPGGKPGVVSKKPMTLLVDDNNVNLRLLEMYCDRRGIPYRTAKDGREAVKIFSEALVPKYDTLLQQQVTTQAFDLILMDLQMPECDGIEATREIRKLEEEQGWQKSVLFIVTGQDSATDRKNAQEAGADEFLTKPVGPKVLDQWVKKWYPEAGI